MILRVIMSEYSKTVTAIMRKTMQNGVNIIIIQKNGDFKAYRTIVIDAQKIGILSSTSDVAMTIKRCVPELTVLKMALPPTSVLILLYILLPKIPHKLRPSHKDLWFPSSKREACEGTSIIAWPIERQSSVLN